MGSPSIKHSITFGVGREVLHITADGHMIIGEGLSAEDATQQAARLLIKAFSEQIEAMIERRLAAREGKL
jgi:hypothetical protein